MIYTWSMIAQDDITKVYNRFIDTMIIKINIITTIIIIRYYHRYHYHDHHYYHHPRPYYHHTHHHSKPYRPCRCLISFEQSSKKVTDTKACRMQSYNCTQQAPIEQSFHTNDRTITS